MQRGIAGSWVLHALPARGKLFQGGLPRLFPTPGVESTASEPGKQKRIVKQFQMRFPWHLTGAEIPLEE